MNPLVDRLPTAVVVGGQPRQVRWQWRPCMRILTAWEDGALTEGEKQQLTLELFYPQLPEPPHRVEALEQAVRFLNGGQTAVAGNGEAGQERLYSFTQDGPFIYAAFRSCHGIDLGETPLHWWSFCGLFMELGEDCTFCRLVSLRQRRRQGRLSPEERRQIARLEPLLRLENQYTPQEQQRLTDFMRAMQPDETKERVKE